MREMRWIAQYVDGSILKEFERTEKGFRERSFYDIRKNELISFGLEGSGLRIGFLVSDGVIGINGVPVNVALEKNGQIWPISGRNSIVYNDIIQYKNAEALIGAHRGEEVRPRATRSRVTQYNIGYKCNGCDQGLGQWFYQVIVHVPSDALKPIYATLRLVAENGFQGRFLANFGKKRIRVNTILKPRTANQLQMNLGRG